MIHYPIVKNYKSLNMLAFLGCIVLLTTLGRRR